MLHFTFLVGYETYNYAQVPADPYPQHRDIWSYGRKISPESKKVAISNFWRWFFYHIDTFWSGGGMAQSRFSPSCHRFESQHSQKLSVWVLSTALCGTKVLLSRVNNTRSNLPKQSQSNLEPGTVFIIRALAIHKFVYWKWVWELP